MARLSNLYGAAPVAQARRGGGGGGTNRPRNPNQNRNRGGGGGGMGGGGTGGDIGGGLYTDDQGGALANQNKEEFINNLLAASGQMDYSGTAYGDYVNKTRAAELLRQYGAAQTFNQSLNPVDWAQQTYGAGWTTTGGTPGGGGGRHGNRHPATPGTTTFNAGTLPSNTVDSYNNWFSNTSPDIFLSNQNLASGLTLPTGGNQDFDRYLTQYYNPKVVANWQQAQAEGIANSAGSPGAAGGAANLTTPLSLADYVKGIDQTTEARNAYAFRPNSMRLPGPLGLSSRWSWWG